MPGTPKKRALIKELRANQKPPPKQRTGGTPASFDSERAKEAAAKAVEARRRNAERRRAAAAEGAGLTPKDEQDAIKTLRKNLKSDDEKVSHAAAVKLLEYTKGRPTQKDDRPEKIVFESAYVNPDLAS